MPKIIKNTVWAHKGIVIYSSKKKKRMVGCRKRECWDVWVFMCPPSVLDWKQGTGHLWSILGCEKNIIGACRVCVTAENKRFRIVAGWWRGGIVGRG